ncbi:hypothetical protein HZH66_006678 [Vespula vulgaris]|uniref:Dynein axonemal assembly factor 11-like CS domain-containing protein n=1 Tax=Vespula vulgaris TaxID=7454 RepID=A0A834K2B0_VESVU|nr:dynein axonemal assembly factor 11 [Vespula vulgaris]KAF7398781.1 hypothetical protein HZH66_006678 [Vespula vulgaris]
MVRITIDLIRKRSEHNEGEISTLEEISLHQENIDKIELLDKVCRNLKILLLQYNIIPKIENLNMLKRLEYLNLALNNIEVIENLQGLESLKKLDLTINFIGDLRSVKTLRYNENLEQLMLTGNPCTDYEGYRKYVISTLPQLKELDMVEILRSERIKALQVYARAKGDVIRGYENYKKIREAQIKQFREKEELKITEIKENEDEDAENERFWKQKSYHTPEDRIAIVQHSLKAEEKKHGISDETKKQKFVPKLFSPCGKPYNMNHPKVPFILNDEDDRDNVILDVGVYRYLDTSYIDVDIQPTYVRVTIKGKILQLTLPCEILVDKSSAKRNVTTGSLVITMPRLHPSMTLHGTSITSRTTKNENPTKKDNAVISIKNQIFTSTREFLEIGPPRIDELDFSKIFENSRKKVNRKLTVDQIKEKVIPNDFIDNPEVPPLE